MNRNTSINCVTVIVRTLCRSIDFFLQLNNLKQITPLACVIIVTPQNVYGPPRKGQREKRKKKGGQKKYDKRKYQKKK